MESYSNNVNWPLFLIEKKNLLMRTVSHWPLKSIASEPDTLLYINGYLYIQIQTLEDPGACAPCMPICEGRLELPPLCWLG